MTELSPTGPGARPDYRFGLLVTLIYAITLFPRIYLHIPWRDELHSWTLASDGCDLPTLFARIRYEGHPSLWYLLIWVACRLWSNPMVMQMMHGIIACGPVFLIAAFAPAPRWQRLLLCSGYFFTFEHAVLARNYATAIVALIGFAAVMTRSPRAYVAAALLLLIAINSNVMAALVVIALSIWSTIRWLREGRPVGMRFMTGVAIVLLGFTLAFVQMRSPPDRHWADATLNFDHIRAGKMAAAMYRSFIPIPSPAREWWGTNLLEFNPVTNNLNTIPAVLGIGTFFLAGWMLPTRRDARALWFTGATILLAFGYFKYVGSLRHHSHFYLLFLLAWWLGQDTIEASGTTQSQNRAGMLFNGVLIAQAAAGLMASVADVFLPFTANRATAQYVAANYPDAALIGHVDFTAAPIGQLNHTEMYFPRQARWARFLVWNMARIGPMTPEMLTQSASKLKAQAPSRPVILVATDDSYLGPERLPRFRRLARFDDSTVGSERYTLYEFIGP